jgi:hypothetical protein
VRSSTSPTLNAIEQKPLSARAVRLVVQADGKSSPVGDDDSDDVVFLFEAERGSKPNTSIYRRGCA